MTMTLAMMYEVETHEISSSVAPRFPIMWGIATFTMEVSISSSTAASVTAIAIRYLYLYLSSASTDAPASTPAAPPGRIVVLVIECSVGGALLRRDVHVHRHARAKRSILAQTL